MNQHRWTQRAALVAALAAVLAILGLTAPAGADDNDPQKGSQKDSSKGAATVGIGTAGPKGSDDRGTFDYEILPRGVVQDFVAISNYRDEPITVRLFAKDATSTADSAFAIQASAEEPTDLGAWISLKKNKLTLPPRTETVVPFQLGVPFDATPGDHAGAIVVSLLSKEPKPEGGSIIVDNRVGMRIHLRVPGDLQPALAIENLKVDWDGAANPLGRGDATVSYTVRNTGNVRMNASGDLTLSRVLGLPGVSAKAPAVTDLLPGGSANYSTTVKDVFGTGPMKARVTLSGVPQDTELDAAPVEVVAEKSFPAWPWLLIAIVVVVLLALGAGTWFERRRRKAKAEAERARIAEDQAAAASAKHRLPVARIVVAAVLALGGVLAGAAPASADKGDTWQATISQPRGKAIEAFDIKTSGGCPHPATNIVGFVFGAGFPKEGGVAVSNIDGPVTNERGFTVAVVDNMINLMATQPSPQQLHGTYKFVVRCIKAEFPYVSYGEYVAAIRFTDPGNWKALAPLTTEKGPVVQIPTTGPDGEPKLDGQGNNPVDPDNQGGAAPDEDQAGSGSASERASQLLDSDPEGSGGTNWVLLGGGVAIAVASLLLVFGNRIPGPWRKP